MRKHTISFKHAFDGIMWSLKTQPNYRFHFAFSILAIVSGFLLHITYFEFIIVVLLVCLGLVIETINTSIEETCDAIDESVRPDIKIAKDTSAGAMLIYAIGSIIIASIIFIPRIINLFV